MDGPRTARPDELPRIIRLAECIFCDDFNVPRSMARRFPLLLSAANADNLHVVADAGQPVSLIATDLQTLVTRGCRIPCGLLGMVGTHADHRGQGHAGALLKAACARLRAQGAMVVWISGRRALYHRSGAAPVWPLFDGRAETARLANVDDPLLALDPVTGENLGELAALQEREPVRFQWQPQWLARVPLSWLTPDLGAGWLVRLGATAVAAVCLRGPDTAKNACELLDWFGDPRAVLSVLGRAAADMGVATVTCRFTSYDGQLRQFMERAGFELRRLMPSPWSLKILDVAGLLDCLRPHLERTLGNQIGALTATEGRLRIATAEAEYVAPGEHTTAQMLFARPDEYEPARAAMPEAVRELVTRALPIPLRHYGLNYV